MNRSAAELPSTAEVVVVGGGVMGTSIAFHLAEAGVRDVVLLERDRLGSGSSAKPLGGVRATFSDPGNIALGQRSLEAFERFDRDLRRRHRAAAGRLPVPVPHRRRARPGGAQHRGPAEPRRQQPDDHPGRGRRAQPAARPVRAGRRVVLPARRLRRPRPGGRGVRRGRRRARGATVLEQTEVHRHRDDRRRDPRGAHRPGPDRHRSGGLRRRRLVRPGRRAWSACRCRSSRSGGRSASPRSSTRAFPTVPFTLDLVTTLYFHNYAARDAARHLQPRPGARASAATSTRVGAGVRRRRPGRGPGLVGRPLEGGWAGLYENTPDHNAIIGASERLRRVFLRHRVLRTRILAGLRRSAKSSATSTVGASRSSTSAVRRPPVRRRGRAAVRGPHHLRGW